MMLDLSDNKLPRLWSCHGMTLVPIGERTVIWDAIKAKIKVMTKANKC